MRTYIRDHPRTFNTPAVRYHLARSWVHTFLAELDNVDVTSFNMSDVNWKKTLPYEQVFGIWMVMNALCYRNCGYVVVLHDQSCGC